MNRKTARNLQSFLILAVILGMFALFGGSKPSATPTAKPASKPSADTHSVPQSLHTAEVRIAWGTTLDYLLRQQGVSRQEGYALTQALKSVYDPRRLRAGQRLQLLFDDDRVLQALHYRPSPALRIRVVRDSLGTFSARADTLPIVSETALVVGQVQTTLYEAVLKAGESPELIMAFSDIFQWDIDFFIDPRRGDRFVILFAKEFVEQPDTRQRTFLRYGPILAAAYVQRDTALVALNYPDQNGRLRYYDINGNSFQKTFLKSPLNYRRISSYFSMGRRHPILKKVRAHTGVDFSAPRGTPVVASADGTIIHLGWNGGYGKCIKISHKNGTFVTLYGHLSRYAKGLGVGSKVYQGQVVGYVGATGLATGPHLHYTMYYGGRPINPLKIRPSSGKPIPAAEKAQFAARRDQLLQRLGMSPERELRITLRPLEGLAR